MSREAYLTILKILTFFCAIGLWYLSAYFSVDGFDIEIQDKRWIGWILALSVTVIELVFNKDGREHNMTLMIAGIAAYAYGIWTNVLGIALMQGVTDLFADAGALVFPMILAMFLEIVPEPLLMWALIGLNHDDLLSKLSGKAERRMPMGMHPAMMREINPDGDTGPIRVADRHVERLRPNGAHPVMMKRR